MLFKHLNGKCWLIGKIKALDGIVDALAKWIWACVITNTSVKFSLLVLNIPIYFLIGKILYGSWKRAWQAFIYWELPVCFGFRRLLSVDFHEKYLWATWRLRFFHYGLWIALYILQYILIKMIFLT